MDTVSLVSGSVSGPKKKRARKSKAKGDDESAGGARAKSAVSGEGGRGKRRASRDSNTEDEDEHDDQMAVETVKRTNEEKVKEKQRLKILTEAFDEEQWRRYEAWRSSKLADSVVRRVCCLLCYSCEG